MAEVATGRAAVREMARAARAFLATLTAEQRPKTVFEFDSEARERWHYVPTPTPPRLGLPRGQMSPATLAASGELLAAGLPTESYHSAKAIMELELVLREVEAREGESVFHRTPDHYCFSIYGEPGAVAGWGWKVDGHHLSINITVVAGEVVSGTPCFFGANPAEVRHGPKKGLRVLAQEEDLGRGLLQSLDPEQRKRATLYPVAPPELITRASRRVEMGRPAGLAAGLLTGDQRDRLMALVRVYTGRMADHAGRDALSKIEAAGVADVFFGWAGSEHPRQPHYYRIHGSTFLAEYDNTQNMANHIHSVWRDIQNDFGVDVLRQHYQKQHA